MSKGVRCRFLVTAKLSAQDYGYPVLVRPFHGTLDPIRVETPEEMEDAFTKAVTASSLGEVLVSKASPLGRRQL